MQPITPKNGNVNNQIPPKLKNVFDHVEYSINRLPRILIQLEYWIIRLLLFGLLLIAAYDLLESQARMSLLSR
jgi:hypothetical protein